MRFPAAPWWMQVVRVWESSVQATLSDAKFAGQLTASPRASLTGVLSDRLGQPSVGNGEYDDRVSNYMTRGVRWVNAQDSLIDAAELMCEGHVHRLLVLDKDEHVVGIISSLDIVSAVVGVVEEHCSATRP